MGSKMGGTWKKVIVAYVVHVQCSVQINIIM